MTEIPLEASPEDVADQRAAAVSEPEQAPALSRRDLPLEADPADVADQMAEVPLDDDDRY